LVQHSKNKSVDYHIDFDISQSIASAKHDDVDLDPAGEGCKL